VTVIEKPSSSDKFYWVEKMVYILNFKIDSIRLQICLLKAFDILRLFAKNYAFETL